MSLCLVNSQPKEYEYEGIEYEYILMKPPKQLLTMPRQRGIPADRDELKVRRGIMVTPKAWEGLAELANQLGYKSKSDLIEAIGRKEIKLIPPDE